MSDASSVEDSRLLDEVRRSLMGVGRTTMKARSLIITASDVAAGLLARLFGVLTHLLGAPQRHSGSFLKRGEVGRVCPHGGILARRVESKPRLVAPPRATERLRPRRRSPPTSGGAAQAALAGLGERERAGFDRAGNDTSDSARRRAALIEWAERGDRLILEDDYDAELCRGRVGALQGLAPDRVLYCGSASKRLAPGMRLGWMLPPSWLSWALITAKAIEDGGSEIAGQLALAHFIGRG